MANIKFRMAARCEAAGRPNNEDNYQLDADLSDNEWGFTADEQITLGKKGALLVVCDGMGGMNAGEVASDLAVKTIKERFSADLLTPKVLASPMAYVKEAIIAADSAIKAHGKAHPETEGMGSTIVMAWMLDKKVYVGWCGDSRCYSYNPQTGLVRLSHDHSYVQELVDDGKLTEDLAFDHPNSNIITRSLGDPNGTARPDVKEYDLHNGDILMLCSDGLCGCLRDKEIEEQIAAHQTSMQDCRDALWQADEAAGWHDNVTIALAQVVSGGIAPQSPATSEEQIKATNKRLKRTIVLLVLLLLVCIVAIFHKPVITYWNKHVNPADTTKVVTDALVEEHNNLSASEELETKEEKSFKNGRDNKKELTGNSQKMPENAMNNLSGSSIPEVQKANEDTATQQVASASQEASVPNAPVSPEESKESIGTQEDTEGVDSGAETGTDETPQGTVKGCQSSQLKEIINSPTNSKTTSLQNNSPAKNYTK